MGSRYVGQRMADNANTVKLKGYATVDIFATYKYDKWAAFTVRGRNLADEEYAIAPYGPTQFILGNPRSFEVALKIDF